MMLRHLTMVRSYKTGLRFNQFQRNYHSVKGVYGYRPVPERKYQVPGDVQQSRNAQGNVYRWVEAFRKHGHKLANVNPINIKDRNRDITELNPAYYGLHQRDTVKPQGLLNSPYELQEETTVGELDALLKQIYCGAAVSAEFSYIENLEEREWLTLQFEQLTGRTVNNDARRQIAELLIKSQAWDNFMAVKYPSVKRYSGEGAESLLAFFWQLLHTSAQESIENIISAMPHRGRTTLQILLLNMRPAKIFRKLNGESEFANDVVAMADVLSHFHTSEDVYVDSRKIHVCMLRNPSHLESPNPVAMGKTRSKQQASGDGAFSNDSSKRFGTNCLTVLLHGDAAFSGQGINQECLNMSYVPHFEVGGTLHVIINNQIGFTTPGDRGRSTEYATDLAKMIQAPVFHVNADDPEMLALTTELAVRYQRHFRKDVFIDVNCFRRWGHNELDDPTFTNPNIYRIIQNRKSVPDTYAEQLALRDILSPLEAETIRNSYVEYLNGEYALAPKYQPEPTFFQRQWSSMTTAPESVTYWDTGLDYSLLSYIGQQSVAFPDDFSVHPHLLKTHVEARLKKVAAGERIDWATAEALAFGSLMYQGHNVRLSGEDVGRGTFSHRHAMLIDQQTNDMFIPLNELKGGLGGKLEVANSILSEEAVLGYEYGMAIDNPSNLIIWEAQFGDFSNGAQIIIDNFIATGETKWMESNGLVMLLPHGYDGMASEHSSCRMERFLQLTDSKETSPDGDNVNVHIVNPSTPAQYFHVLRRQMLRNFRKPLIVVAPKTLLRLSSATSTHNDFAPGTYFRNVFGDDYVDPNKVEKVILCSGKHYYNLNDERLAKGIINTAIVRLESLCPFPLHDLQEELTKYKNAATFVWSQEEHRNMGAWTFVRPRFEYLVGKQLKYAGRIVAPAVATGIGKVHKREAEEVITQPFKI